MHRLVKTVLAAAAAAALAAPAAMAQGSPGLSFVSPSANGKVTSTDIPIQLSVSNFNLECDRVGQQSVPGRGHIHFMIDGMSMAQLTNFYCSPSFTVSGQGLKPGKHTLIAVLAGDMHDEIDSTMAKETIDYEPVTPPAPLPAPINAGTPTIQITGPADGSTVAPKFDLQLNWSNFNPSCDLEGKPNVVGYGHVHVFVDPDLQAMMGGNMMMAMAGMISMPCTHSLPVDLSAWPSGQHTIMALLVNNDHTPVMPNGQMVMSEVKVNVQPAGAATPAGGVLPKTGASPYELPLAVLLLLGGAFVGASPRLRRLLPRRSS